MVMVAILYKRILVFCVLCSHVGYQKGKCTSVANNLKPSMVCQVGVLVSQSLVKKFGHDGNASKVQNLLSR